MALGAGLARSPSSTPVRTITPNRHQARHPPPARRLSLCLKEPVNRARTTASTHLQASQASIPMRLGIEREMRLESLPLRSSDFALLVKTLAT